MILRFLSGFYGGMKSISSSFYLTWGMNYARWGQPSKALFYFNRAAKLNAKGANIFYQRGLLLIAMGLTESAVVDFDTAIESDPEHMGAYLNRSMMHALAGRSEEARNDVEKAVALGADRPSLESRVAELQAEAQ
jgi:tetratricopeptide (TPR) repeat protein